MASSSHASKKNNSSDRAGALVNAKGRDDRAVHGASQGRVREGGPAEARGLHHDDLHLPRADDEKQFKRLKRKTSGDWTFLVSGEWSQSPWHQGTHSFYIRSSEDKQYWALLNGGRPRRIVAVAHTPGPLSLTFVGASMMQTLYKQGGDWIGERHDYGDIYEDLFNKIYD